MGQVQVYKKVSSLSPLSTFSFCFVGQSVGPSVADRLTTLEKEDILFTAFPVALSPSSQRLHIFQGIAELSKIVNGSVLFKHSFMKVNIECNFIEYILT